MGNNLEVKVHWRKRWCELLAEGNCVTVRWGGKEAEVQNPAPTNRNHVEGMLGWVSWLETAKPDTINNVSV
jgi:hypothetical protein